MVLRRLGPHATSCPIAITMRSPRLRPTAGGCILEARYNYEALETGSLWVGYNFSASNKLSLNVTPMLGGVFGKTTGVAPGLRGSLSWWRFYFYGEGEFVITTDKRSDSFLTGWSELTVCSRSTGCALGWCCKEPRRTRAISMSSEDFSSG